MKETITLTSLPQISFAHIFNSESNYTNFLPKREHSFEFGYIKSGKVIWTINHATYELSDGDIFLLPHDTDIRTSCPDGNEHHCVGFLSSFEFHNQQRQFITISRDSPFSSMIKEKIDNLILFFNSNNERKQKLYALIFELIDLINEHIEEASSLTQEVSGEMLYVNKAKKYIAQNISTEISLKDLADHLHISVPYICTIFKKFTDETIITYINKQKIFQLKNFITHYNFSLKEACALVGIKDPSYASRLFRKHEKLSLREFKFSLRNKP